MNELKNINGIEVSEIQLSCSNGVTTLLAKVTNKTEAVTPSEYATITLLKENGEEMVTARAYIGLIQAGQSTQLNLALTSNYVDAYDLKIAFE